MWVAEILPGLDGAFARFLDEHGGSGIPNLQVVTVVRAALPVLASCAISVWLALGLTFDLSIGIVRCTSYPRLLLAARCRRC